PAAPGGKVGEGGVELLAGQVPGGSEEDQRVRPFGLAHDAGFSAWPPNSLRIADSTLLANSAAPRELKRSYRAVVSTCAGTPSSTAAATVQRPSPESETFPWNPESCGSS